MENTFQKPIIPANEQERLKKLYGYGVLETYDSSGSFNKITSLAARIFKTPIGLVSLVDKERVILKGNTGMEGTTEVDRGVSLCSLAILKEDVTVFHNAKEEACLASNPFVMGSFGLTFYAAAPLRTTDGYNIGVVGVADKRAREFTKADQSLLEALASVVMDELEERKLLKAV